LDEINVQVAERLRRLRRAGGLSLEELASRAGVSRAMLSQIETLKTNPTIAILWRISQGLGVPFSELLGPEASRPVRIARASEARYLYSADETFRSRPLLSNVPGHRVELYELRLEPSATENAEPHPDGSFEQIYVMEGKLRMGIGSEAFELARGDALLFPADQAHRYEALGKRAFVGLSLILYAD